jgi:mycothiol system anti-sigma-R factor
VNGDPTVSCTEVRAHLYEYLDDEFADAAGATALRTSIDAHLSVCTSCDGGYRFELVLRRTVQRCCSDTAPADRVPDALQGRILAALARCDAEEAGGTART